MYQKHQTKYSLSGKIYCEKHKCSFIRKIRHYKNKPNIVYWYCGNFHKTGKKNCIPAYFKERDIYNILINNFKKYNNIYKNEICNDLMDLYTSFFSINKNTEYKAKLQNQLCILKNKKDKLLDLALDGFLSKEDLVLKNTSIENEIFTINKQLNKIEIYKSDIKKQNEYLNTLKENIYNELEISYANLEDYIDELLDKIIVKEKVDNTQNKSRIEFNIILV